MNAKPSPAAGSVPCDYPKLWDSHPYDPPRSVLREQQLAYVHELARGLLPATQMESVQHDAQHAHPSLAAGYTYFAQLAAHDLSWHHFVHAPWHLGQSAPPRLLAVVNRHRARFDLQPLYGEGPVGTWWLHEASDADVLRVVRRAYGRGHEYDLPRDETERALVADPRQDESVMIAQLHVTLARVHNLLVLALRKLGLASVGAPTAYQGARAILTWHYQWLLVNDLLPRLLDERRVETLRLHLAQLAKGVRPELTLFRGRSNAMPAEFPFAVLRFGHALVRESYRPNRSLYAMHLTPPRWRPRPAITPGSYVLSFRRLPPGWGVDWNLFVPTARDEHQVARRIGPRVCWSAGNMPIHAGEDVRRKSLPFLTLRAGWEEPLRLCDGQSAASKQFTLPVVPSAVSGVPDPLWIYVLREAEAQTGGVRLGALGSTVLWQVVVNALLTDPDSYLARAPTWQPFLGDARGRFTLAELVFLPDLPAASDAARVDELAQRIRAGLA